MSHTSTAAAEEERFRRVKHWAGFPSEAIRYCLAEAGVSLDQVDHVAVNQDSRANLGRRVSYILGNGNTEVELESFGGDIKLRRAGAARTRRDQ